MTSSSGDETCKILTLRRLLKYVIVETGEVDVGIVGQGRKIRRCHSAELGRPFFYLE